MKRLIFALFFFNAFVTAQSHIESGDVGMYDVEFLGQSTTSGETYDPNLFTAGHRFIPVGTTLIVVNPLNQKSIQVRIIDQVDTQNYVIFLSAIAVKSLMPLGNMVSLYGNVQQPTPSRLAVSPTVQQPQIVQQVQPVQQPQIVQQVQPVQQPQIVQQVQPIQQPQIVQQVQQPQIVQQVQPVQQPQIVQQVQPVQQPQIVQQVQQPQIVQKIQPVQQAQQPQIVQQVQPVQQPQIVQQIQNTPPIVPTPTRIFQSGEIAFLPNTPVGITATGQSYNPNTLTASHSFLPFGTRVKVENPRTKRTIVVTIADRGASRRVLDLSYKAATELGIISQGKIQANLYILDPIPAHYYNLPPNFEAWTLQLNSTAIENSAISMVQNLGREAFYSEHLVNGSAMYRVYYGRYDTKAEAEAQIPALQSRGFATAMPKSMLLELHKFIDFSAFGGPSGRE